MHLCLILFLNLKQNCLPSSTFSQHNNLLSRRHLIFQPISHLVDRLEQSALHTASVYAFNCGWTQWEQNWQCRMSATIKDDRPMCLRNALHSQLHSVQRRYFVRKGRDTDMITQFHSFNIFYSNRLSVQFLKGEMKIFAQSQSCQMRSISHRTSVKPTFYIR